MSAELELRWLKTQNTKGTVKRFAEFCKEDVKEASKQDSFDLKKYQDAVKLVMRKLDNTYSVNELFSPDKTESENSPEAEQKEDKHNVD